MNEAFILRQKLVRTREQIGPDLIIFVKKQSTFHGVIHSYGPVKRWLFFYKNYRVRANFLTGADQFLL